MDTLKMRGPIAAALLALLAVSSTASAFSNIAIAQRGNLMCVDVSVTPPGVAINCAVYILDGNGPTFPASATTTGSTGLDIFIDWDFGPDRSQVSAFHVYRGAEPTSLVYRAAASPDASQYIDRNAVVSGRALWYQVVALGLDGTPWIESPIVSTTVAVEIH